MKMGSFRVDYGSHNNQVDNRFKTHFDIPVQCLHLCDLKQLHESSSLTPIYTHLINKNKH